MQSAHGLLPAIRGQTSPETGRPADDGRITEQRRVEHGDAVDPGRGFEASSPQAEGMSGRVTEHAKPC